ncbi:hypothetical protein OIU34_28680 [Pararhizobium sp. BT-229]|uniref:hypothetical protein n=1 Tax=Pararhizobium sp. BT-229 TaxID=2986923 RepID=UPI0021F7F0E3|nr:hypothetical protein [Pararhizobium sp. BT-229]MCV9965851.1 hypothetical protein [Pararhizobium sp. BT-229]
MLAFTACTFSEMYSLLRSLFGACVVVQAEQLAQIIMITSHRRPLTAVLTSLTIRPTLATAFRASAASLDANVHRVEGQTELQLCHSSMLHSGVGPFIRSFYV